MTHKVLIAGQWRESNSTGTFQAEDPQAAVPIPENYPISSWADCEDALDAAQAAFAQLRSMPVDRIARFLECFADRIDARSREVCEMAARETALPVEPRLASGELPRTTGQLRRAAAAVRTQSWCRPVIDSNANIRSCLGPIGPVAVFGPNNFPLAFGSISGGDFAAAIAAGNPVIAKANPMHPGTTRLLAEEALEAVEAAGLPVATVQLIYHIAHSDGEKLTRDPRLAALGFTGSRTAGLKLKAAADAVGKPAYLELSSINPVVILPGALTERSSEICEELKISCLMGTGQFCTSPGLIILPESEAANAFVAELCEKFTMAPVGLLFSRSGRDNLRAAIAKLQSFGAELLCGGDNAEITDVQGYRVANTVLKVSDEQFLANPEGLQTEAFGNATMIVSVTSHAQAAAVVAALDGNLTACIYSATDGSDDEAYNLIEPLLRQRVGRLLNDQMPTGVAVSPAMNHGGPFPATGHPGFTAVGIPAAITRFSKLQCYDNVRPHRLPLVLRDENPGDVWRLIDGKWTTTDVGQTTAMETE